MIKEAPEYLSPSDGGGGFAVLSNARRIDLSIKRYHHDFSPCTNPTTKDNTIKDRDGSLQAIFSTDEMGSYLTWPGRVPPSELETIAFTGSSILADGELAIPSTPGEPQMVRATLVVLGKKVGDKRKVLALDLQDPEQNARYQKAMQAPERISSAKFFVGGDPMRDEGAYSVAVINNTDQEAPDDNQPQIEVRIHRSSSWGRGVFDMVSKTHKDPAAFQRTTVGESNDPYLLNQRAQEQHAEINDIHRKIAEAIFRWAQDDTNPDVAHWRNQVASWEQFGPKYLFLGYREQKRLGGIDQFIAQYEGTRSAPQATSPDSAEK